MARQLRPMKVRLSALARAIARADRVCKAWEEHGPKPRNGCYYRQWQANLIEILLLPRIWERMIRGMVLDGHAGADRYYGKPYRYTDGALPGYIMDGWNGPPTERWRYSHSPGACWDGIRRNLYPSLAEDLRSVAFGYKPPDRLSSFWGLQLIADAEPVAPF